MYQGSQTAAIFWLVVFYVFAYGCLVGSFVKTTGLGPVIAAIFVLTCCMVMLLMTPFAWLGVLLLAIGIALAILVLRKVWQTGSASSPNRS